MGGHESTSAETRKILGNPCRVKGWVVENQAESEEEKYKNEMDKGVFQGQRLIS